MVVVVVGLCRGPGLLCGRSAHVGVHTLEPGQDKQVGGREQDRPQREQREGRAGGRY